MGVCKTSVLDALAHRDLCQEKGSPLCEDVLNIHVGLISPDQIL